MSDRGTCGHCGHDGRVLDENLRCEFCRRPESRDWPAFWRSLPPRELLAAAKAMPKIAGPWDEHDRRYAVHDAPPSCPVASGHRTPADRASADAALRAADWVLVDEEPEEGGRG